MRSVCALTCGHVHAISYVAHLCVKPSRFLAIRGITRFVFRHANGSADGTPAVYEFQASEEAVRTAKDPETTLGGRPSPARDDKQNPTF